MPRPLNLAELEALAESRLRKDVYDYYAGGAGDEVTLRANQEAFRRLRLRPRVLVDVETRNLSAEVLGVPMAMPVVLAPTALHRMAHPEGELATARAARNAGLLMTLSSITSVPLAEVAQVGGWLWLQLYLARDRSLSEDLVRGAEAAGYRALVLTVDAPLLGRRERDLRNPFVLPEGVKAVHFPEAPTAQGLSPMSSYICQPGLSWKDLAWLRAFTKLPILLKGVVRADDAERAVSEGIDGLWVSNHGGRQLDGAIPTADALPEVVAAVSGRVPVVVDGGVRRGTDVLKGLALGATAVAVGRPLLWGLAVGGEDGVRQVFDTLREELSLAMALAGCRTLKDITRDLVV